MRNNLIIKKRPYQYECYNLPDELNVCLLYNSRIYDGITQIKYVESNKEEFSFQSNKYEIGYFYAIYNSNFLPVSLNKQGSIPSPINI